MISRPERSTPSTTSSPALRFRAARSRTPRSSVPLTESITSPGEMPTACAGDPGTTPATRTPGPGL
ncbi:MAG: hypothetical protein RXR47_03450 [Nitrososphaeria archaeon]